MFDPRGAYYRPLAMPAVEVRALAKSYAGAFGRGGHLALRGVERSIAFGLIGLNGAGKTTTTSAR